MSETAKTTETTEVADFGNLVNYETGEILRKATATEREDSLDAVGHGGIWVDGVACYVED